jgi:hypothetical protein
LEEAAQAYLQHYQKEHPEELKKEQAPPLQVQEHLLIRSDKGKTGYKGVKPVGSRYQAACTTPPCRLDHLGTFGTPEEAAQAYLQHHQKEHPGALKKKRAPPLQLQEHLLIRYDLNFTGYTGVAPNHGRYQAKYNTPPCRLNHLGCFGTPEEAAQTYLQHYQKEHPEELKQELAPLLQVQADDKKRKLQSMAETEHLSGQLADDNQALKRCKEEFIEEDHAAMQQMISAVEAVARCSICCDTMKHASTVSGCGHTFCRSCIEEALRVTGCCPECLLPAWRRDIRDSRRANGVMEVVGLK